MPYVRISYMRPRPGQDKRLTEILDELSRFYRQSPGYVLGYRLEPHQHDATKRMGRVGVWESEDAAIDAAQNQHALALRSQLLQIIDEDSHEELSFEGVPDR